MLELYPHQREALESVEHLNRVAFYHDMGLGKTFTGSEKMHQLGNKVNLVVCQKSKISDWIDHFNTYYKNFTGYVFDLTNKSQLDVCLWEWENGNTCIGVINYELVFRRPELKKLEQFTLMLDESSLIQNETAKRSKFIMNLNFENLILLSGTPTGGKYEKLWSQLKMLGYKLTKKSFYNMYIDFHYDNNEGFPIMIIDGYKNVERLKRKMREYGCHFLKTEEVLDLPQQIDTTIYVDTTKEYRKFRKDCIVTISDDELVGDTTLTKMLYERQLCGHYNKEKLNAFRDLVESTDDRLIVFYNFTAELVELEQIVCEYARPYSVVNGAGKDLRAYEEESNSITFIQYQAGAMGLNLQKANKIVYFTPPLSSELFEQSKKRIHRIGQEKPCFYYYMTCKNSIEEKIYNTLAMRRDYTNTLFEKEI